MVTLTNTVHLIYIYIYVYILNGRNLQSQLAFKEWNGLMEKYIIMILGYGWYKGHISETHFIQYNNTDIILIVCSYGLRTLALARPVTHIFHVRQGNTLKNALLRM